MGGAWKKFILLCIQARQDRFKSSGVYHDGKPSYIDPALIPPEGGETEDAGYQQ
jgi:hypothetical protein